MVLIIKYNRLHNCNLQFSSLNLINCTFKHQQMIQRFIIPVFLFMFQLCFSEEYFPSAKFTHSDGLSGLEITDLIIDPDEFLWVATTNGLNRFDGYNFIQYIADPGDKNSFPSDYIKDIQYDHKGNIWSIADNALISIDYFKKATSIYYMPDANTSFARSDMIYNMYVADNKVFVLADNFLGYLSIDERKTHNFLSKTELNSFNSLNITSICYNKASGKIILYNDNDIFLFDTSSKEIISVTQSATNFFKSDYSINGIVAGHDNNCYIYTQDQIGKYDIKTGRTNNVYQCRKDIIKVVTDTENHLLILTNSNVINLDFDRNKENIVFEFKLDRERPIDVLSFVINKAGILWIGSNAGLFKFNPHKNTFHVINIKDIGYFTKSEKFKWAGFINKNQGLIFLESGKVLNFYIDKDINAHNISVFRTIYTKINSITCNNKGDFLISTSKGLKIWSDYSISKEAFLKEEVVMPDSEIFLACFDQPGIIWMSTTSGIYQYNNDRKKISRVKGLSGLISGHDIKSIECDRNYLWVNQLNQINEFNKYTGVTTSISFPENKRPTIYKVLNYSKDILYVGTSDGLFQYSVINKKLTLINKAIYLYRAAVFALEKTDNNKVWASTRKGIVLFDPQTGIERLYNTTDGLIIDKFNLQLSARSQDGLLIFGGAEEMTLFHPDSILPNQHIPNIHFTQVTLSGNKSTETIMCNNSDTLVVEYFFKHIKINFSALDFWAPEKNRYMYSLTRNGAEQEWIDIGNNNFFEVTEPKAGNYKLLIKGFNSDGHQSIEPAKLYIQVISPFWRNPFAYLVYVLFFIMAFYLSIVFRTRHFRNLNRKYKEREFISKQIQLQKDELTIKNKNITDSLNYAKRIQMAMMPSEKLFKKFFNDSFILHISKDIVSGDFYWVSEVDEKIFFAAVDCTGHGVPGAFMSIIGFELFRKITETDKIDQPALILDSLSDGFTRIFRDVENYILRDGMDVAFCSIDKEMKTLEYAGAFNPLYIIRDNTINEIKGDRFSVGLNVEGIENKFKNNIVQLFKGDIIYIFTDGFADQFGGPEGKKYKYRRFRHLLLALHQLPMDRQADFLRRSINEWRGNLDQVDDILVMGIRIN